MTGDSAAFRAQHEAIRAEFTAQAESWGRDAITSDLLWAVDLLGPLSHFEALDVAAGSGLLSRALASRVRSVVAVDITPAMMEAGAAAVAREEIANVRFQAGAAEDLPFPDASFDMVATRFSIHHFASPATALAEMVRVCRPGGRVGVIDIVAPEDEESARRINAIERLRDPTHTRSLTRRELRSHVEEAGILVAKEAPREVSMRLDAWLDRTRPPADARAEIIEAFRAEIQGGPATGMRPFAGGDGLFFTHVWCAIAGVRSA
jgi:SAM-dependent methyltransferase